MAPRKPKMKPPIDPSPAYLDPVYDGETMAPEEFVATTVAHEAVKMTSAAADIGLSIAAPLEQAISYLRDALVMLGALGPFSTRMQTAKANCAAEINAAIKLLESL